MTYNFIYDCYCSSSAFMYYYDNPKGMIPAWLINWAAKVLYIYIYNYIHRNVNVEFEFVHLSC